MHYFIKINLQNYFQNVISGKGDNIGTLSKNNYKFLIEKIENNIIVFLKKILKRNSKNSKISNKK